MRPEDKQEIILQKIKKHLTQTVSAMKNIWNG